MDTSKIYLVLHISFPSQIDGDAVEYTHIVAAYADKDKAEAEAAHLTASDHDNYAGDYGKPYYMVEEITYHP